MKPSSLKAKIRRLSRELKEIDEFAYGDAGSDPILIASTLERKRDDAVRSTVLQLHTAIEDVLNDIIICKILEAKPTTRVRKMLTVRGKALHKLLFTAEGYGFDTKLNLAVAIGVLSDPARKKLMELNTLRNKCSHNWLLRRPIRRGRRPLQKKPPLLTFGGNDLHRVETLRKFCGEYGMIYARLFVRYMELEDA